MNKLLIISALLLSTGVAHADNYRLVSTDDSALSALCISAAQSKDALIESAQAIGIKKADLGELRCNGQTLPVFLSRLRSIENSQKDVHPLVTYAFNKTDSSALTELCYAAVQSPREFAEVKDKYFNDQDNIEKEVRCNGIPLQEFARKYGARALTASNR